MPQLTQGLNFALRIVFAAIACVFAFTVVQGQGLILTVHSTANVRAKPSSKAKIVAHLTAGAELKAENLDQTFGYYHIETADGTVGWVYRSIVHLEGTDDPEPEPPSIEIATELDESWEKPAVHGSVMPGPVSDPCPAEGELGGDIETNRRKNRIDVPSSYHPIAFNALTSLWPYKEAPTNRAKWTADQLHKIAAFEGIPVSMVGYIVAVKKQFGGGGETTNCYFSSEWFVDSHVALVESRGQGEEKAVVVETTPRSYSKHPSWVYSKLRALEDSPDPIRISGWSLMDPVHKGHLKKYRATLWEVHPVTKIEVFKNGKWVQW